MKRIVMCLLLMLLASSTWAQKYIFQGKILDQDNGSLPGATIELPEVKTGAVTRTDGTFTITGLTNATIFIRVSFMGYKTYTDTMVIRNNQPVIIHLIPETQSLSEVVVHDNYTEQRQREEALNLETVTDDYLKQNRSGSLMESLERLPGVSSIEIGSGKAKPIIRGLSFNQVAVIQNGIKYQGQQWGADHGIEVDQYAVDQVEVIKGPASLMYGSDAIGGIINIRETEVPPQKTIGSTIDITAKNNNALFGTSVKVYARNQRWFLNARLTYTDYADYKVPTDSVDIYSYKVGLYHHQVRNTAGNERDIHFSFGRIADVFFTRFYLSNLGGKDGFFANAHGLEPRSVDTEMHDKSSRDILYPYHRNNHLMLINRSQLKINEVTLKTELGYQNNFIEERSEYVSHGYMPGTFPDTLPFSSDLEREFNKDTWSGNISAEFLLFGNNQITSGGNFEQQNNKIDGCGFIIPAFNQFSSGAFIYDKIKLSDKHLLHLGIRYDYGKISTQSYSDWFKSPVVNNGDTVWTYLQRAASLNRNFNNFTWAVGYNYNLDNLLLKVNIGKSYRMPIAKELAANGVNYHRFSYEVGDSTLDAESAYQLDLGFEYHHQKYALGLSPFVNYFSNYIYLNPSSEHDVLYGNGNQVFYYTQSEVLRFGGEIHAHYNIVSPLTFGIIGEYVYSEQLSGDKKGYTLPFSPPASVLFNLKYQPELKKLVSESYFSVDYKVVTAQNNIVPPEKTTPGYQLINIAAGGKVAIGKQQLEVNLQVKNLLNTKYFNHTSYYRLINLPEAGRNFIINISIPLSKSFIKN